MRVIICGAGRVGQGIAARLAGENNAVTVIDVSAELIRNITTELDVRGVVGHGAHPDVLKRAGIDAADMIVAVTYSDEVNMVACQIAHSLFNVPTKVARVRAQGYLDSEWRDLYSRENMPIDIIISPEIEIGKAILRRLNTPGAFDVVPFADGQVKLVGIRVDENCPVINTPIRQIPDLFPDLHAMPVGMRHDESVHAPDPNDQLAEGDEVYFIVKSEHAGRLVEIMGNPSDKARHVVIIGGGNIGRYVAGELENVPGLRIRMIERSKEKAEYAAEQLKRTVILNGDAMNAGIQQEAGVHNSEIVLCLTDDDKTNILSGVLAKKVGTKQAVSLINEVSMQDLQAELGLDMVIDPRATTVSSILRHVRRGRILDVFTLADGGAEIMEGEVLETSSLVGKTVEEVNNLGGIAVGAVVTQGKILTDADAHVIKRGDRLVLLVETESLRQVEQMFRVSMDYF